MAKQNKNKYTDEKWDKLLEEGIKYAHNIPQRQLMKDALENQYKDENFHKMQQDAFHIMTNKNVVEFTTQKDRDLIGKMFPVNFSDPSYLQKPLESLHRSYENFVANPQMQKEVSNLRKKLDDMSK
ncbi:uncharacterized protein LOC116350918 [Contarinia nasturtii]|uniref:uncharacterized protein LOC116350918 n=1 Tax=Contarinia nasturtii TaxID=265458 RepID=UPI0012D4225F|nr:uncharacterized protein LOC116350918 [Contarinia nasturtii]